MNNNQQTFLALVKAGLWEQDVRLLPIEEVNYQEVYRLAKEQSVLGLVTAGLEHVVDIKAPQKELLSFVSYALQLEQLNTAMNDFIAVLVEALRRAKVNAILIKGQGIARCYERPLWRACGDIDFLLTPLSYNATKTLLSSYSQTEVKEVETTKEFCLTIEGWTIELHGSLHCRLTKKLDVFLDQIQDNCNNESGVRVWVYGGTDIALPSVENDIFIIFTHIVKHFFREGVGLKQLCDWCRLLWTFRTEIDKNTLKRKLKEAGIMSEWKAFAALSVGFLGMPVEAMPLYSTSRRWKRKASRIMAFIIETGCFGHNRNFSYMDNKPRLLVKIISFWRHTSDLCRQFRIFPIDSIIAWKSMVRIGIKSMMERN